MRTYYDNLKPSPPLVGQGDIQPVETKQSDGVDTRLAPKAKGRKKRDAPKWTDFSYWFNLIDKNKKELKPKERIELARWALEYIAENMGKPKAPETKTDPASLLAALESQPRK